MNAACDCHLSGRCHRNLFFLSFISSRFHGCEVSVKQFATHRWWQFNPSKAVRVDDRIRRFTVADIFKQSAQADAVPRSTQKQHGCERDYGGKRHPSAFACSGTNSQRC
jgi:hypothetical protein